MKFQNPSIHHSFNTQTDRQTDTQTDKPKAICPSNFFKVGGIKRTTTEVSTWNDQQHKVTGRLKSILHGQYYPNRAKCVKYLLENLSKPIMNF